MIVDLCDHVRTYFETTHTKHRVPIPTPNELKGKDAQTNCLGREAATPGDPLGIFKICLVGALYSRPLGGLYPRDKQWGKLALALCCDHGFKIAHSPQLYPQDLQTGRDYIKQKRPPQNIDLIVFCTIRNPSQTEYVMDYDHNEPSLEVSPHHFDDEAFPKALKRDRPKAIVTFFDPGPDPMLLSDKKLVCEIYPHSITSSFWVMHRNDPEEIKAEYPICKSLLVRQDLLSMIQEKESPAP